MSDRPELDTLERFLERLLETRANDVEFVVLFGSMARGNWSRGSDYDVLVGLRAEDGKRLTDRIGELESLVDGNVQVFPYDRPAWERMFESFHPLLLEVLDHGIVLFDRGRFASMRPGVPRLAQRRCGDAVGIRLEDRAPARQSRAFSATLMGIAGDCFRRHLGLPSGREAETWG